MTGPALDSMIDLQCRVAIWGNRTFPDSTIYSKLKHFLKEAGELQHEIQLYRGPVDRERTASEMADCAMLLFHMADELGINLHGAIEAKFDRVQRRRWGPPDEHGVVEHIREGDE